MAKDLPRTVHPKLTKGGIERARLRNARPALPRLRHDSQPHAVSAVRLGPVLTHEAGGGVDVQPTVVIQIDESRPIRPTHARYLPGLAELLKVRDQRLRG